jgi:hypothetical protein
VVSFTPLPLYPWGKSSRYPLEKRLGGPQSQSGRHGEEKILDSNSDLSVVQPVASHYTDYTTLAPKMIDCIFYNFMYTFGYGTSEEITSGGGRLFTCQLVLMNTDTFSSLINLFCFFWMVSALFHCILCSLLY